MSSINPRLHAAASKANWKRTRAMSGLYWQVLFVEIKKPLWTSRPDQGVLHSRLLAILEYHQDVKVVALFVSLYRLDLFDRLLPTGIRGHPSTEHICIFITSFCFRGFWSFLALGRRYRRVFGCWSHAVSAQGFLWLFLFQPWLIFCGWLRGAANFVMICCQYVSRPPSSS